MFVSLMMSLLVNAKATSGQRRSYALFPVLEGEP
jgi:hypothetical protein